MKDLITGALRASCRWGRDNGSKRSEKNFGDFMETTLANMVIDKANEVIAENSKLKEEIKQLKNSH